jgi:hypothetical protein
VEYSNNETENNMTKVFSSSNTTSILGGSLIVPNTTKIQKTKNQNNNFSQISFSNFENDDNVETVENSILNIGKNNNLNLKLRLTGELFFGNELIITPNGLINSVRNHNDGQTFFGINNSKDYTGTYYNDYIINYPFENEEYISNHTGRIFDISYSKKTNDYSLYLMNSNFCIYYEINNKIYFKNEKEYYILIGKILMTISQKDCPNKQKIINIKIEFEDESKKEQLFEFKNTDVPIDIGRNKENKIFIDDISISKKHGVILYSESQKSFIYKDKRSTNGSTLIMKDDDSIKIKGEMKCKLNDIMFNIMEIP